MVDRGIPGNDGRLDAQVLPADVLPDAADGPASDDMVEHRVHGGSKPPAAPQRQLANAASVELVAGVGRVLQVRLLRNVSTPSKNSSF